MGAFKEISWNAHVSVIPRGVQLYDSQERLYNPEGSDMISEIGSVIPEDDSESSCSGRQ